eukprot:g16830.t1
MQTDQQSYPGRGEWAPGSSILACDGSNGFVGLNPTVECEEPNTPLKLAGCSRRLCSTNGHGKTPFACNSPNYRSRSDYATIECSTEACSRNECCIQNCLSPVGTEHAPLEWLEIKGCAPVCYCSASSKTGGDATYVDTQECQNLWTPGVELCKQCKESPHQTIDATNFGSERPCTSLCETTNCRYRTSTVFFNHAHKSRVSARCSVTEKIQAYSDGGEAQWGKNGAVCRDHCCIQGCQQPTASDKSGYAPKPNWAAVLYDDISYPGHSAPQANQTVLDCKASTHLVEPAGSHPTAHCESSGGRLKLSGCRERCFHFACPDSPGEGHFFLRRDAQTRKCSTNECDDAAGKTDNIVTCCIQMCTKPVDPTKLMMYYKDDGTGPNGLEDARLWKAADSYPGQSAWEPHTLRCADGYTGTATVQCPAPGAALILDGCRPFDCFCNHGEERPQSTCRADQQSNCKTCNNAFQAVWTDGASPPNRICRSRCKHVDCEYEIDGQYHQKHESDPDWCALNGAHTPAQPDDMDGTPVCRNTCCAPVCKAMPAASERFHPYAGAKKRNNVSATIPSIEKLVTSWSDVFYDVRLYPKAGSAAAWVSDTKNFADRCAVGYHGLPEFRCRTAGNQIEAQGCEDNCKDFLTDKKECTNRGYGEAVSAFGGRASVGSSTSSPAAYELGATGQLTAEHCCTPNTGMCGAIFVRNDIGLVNWLDETDFDGRPARYCARLGFGRPFPVNATHPAEGVGEGNKECCQLPTCAVGYFKKARECPEAVLGPGAGDGGIGGNLPSGFTGERIPTGMCTTRDCEQSVAHCCERRKVCPYKNWWARWIPAEHVAGRVGFAPTASCSDAKLVNTNSGRAAPNNDRWGILTSPYYNSSALLEVEEKFECAREAIRFGMSDISSEKALDYCRDSDGCKAVDENGRTMSEDFDACCVWFTELPDPVAEAESTPSATNIEGPSATALTETRVHQDRTPEDPYVGWYCDHSVLADATLDSAFFSTTTATTPLKETLASIFWDEFDRAAAEELDEKEDTMTEEEERAL